MSNNNELIPQKNYYLFFLSSKNRCDFKKFIVNNNYIVLYFVNNKLPTYLYEIWLFIIYSFGR